MNNYPVTFWRVDAQHAEFDGAFTRCFTLGVDAHKLARILAPWGWLVDAYEVTLADEKLRGALKTSLLFTLPWPCIPTDQLVSFALLKSTCMANTNPELTFVPSEVPDA